MLSVKSFLNIDVHSQPCSSTPAHQLACDFFNFHHFEYLNHKIEKRVFETPKAFASRLDAEVLNVSQKLLQDFNLKWKDKFENIRTISESNKKIIIENMVRAINENVYVRDLLDSYAYIGIKNDFRPGPAWIDFSINFENE